MKAIASRLGVAPFLFCAGLLLGSSFTGVALAYQGHMHAAERGLNVALTQLNAAEHDKAGHRDQAIGLVNQAIQQVQMGIAAGAR